MQLLMTLAVLLVVAATVRGLYRSWRISKPVEPPKVNVRALSVEQAKAIVDQLLSERLDLHAGFPTVTTELDQLGPITREFFERFSFMRGRRGALELSAAAVGPSRYVAGFQSIGHVEDWDVVQRPGEDEVFVVEGSETDEGDMDGQFPSVYHLVVDEMS